MDTRKFDLEHLVDSRSKARNAYERDLYDRTIDTILRESGAVRERREKLMMAVRNDDKRAIQRFQHDLMMIQADKTYGRNF